MLSQKKGQKRKDKTALEIYKSKTPTSKKIFESKSRKFHVNGVHHNIRFFDPYPFVTTRAKGKFLVDVDQNKYVDYWMGHWSLILGHRPKQVLATVKEQLQRGWMYGTLNDSTIKLSEMIQRAAPVAEKIRYTTSGTEATMYAVRLARSVTGKNTVAKIEGGWHGYTSDLLSTVNWPFTKSESKGLVDEKFIVSIPLNDTERSISILDSVKDDLACVIIEPVLGGGGCIPAMPEYLKAIQEYVHKNNALFLLDEIVTGFRFDFGCYYSSIKGIDPDIVTLGKIIGGGFPIGAICGKEEVMSCADTKLRQEKDSRCFIGGGTFSANPVSMEAGHSVLEYLKKHKTKVYPKIAKLGQQTRKKIDKIFDGKTVTTGIDSLFLTHFLGNGISEVKNAQDAANCNVELLHMYHFEIMARNRIFFLPGKLGAYSTAHTQKDVKDLVYASEKFSSKL